MNYINYNREERNLCTHLFRLLLLEKNDYQILREFLFPISLKNFEIFTEVALIRDAYHNFSFEDKIKFVDDIIKVIKVQENVEDCRNYSELDSGLNNPSKTHPRQIRQKAKEINYNFSKSENKIYGCLQSFFNAKPDLAIILDDEIIAYEAKLTLGFNAIQLERTNKIVEVWSKLLFKDLGYSTIPKYSIKKLGMAKYNPDISWEEIRDIALKVLSSKDKSLITLNSILNNST
jgi:hypothetical protein